MSGLGKNAEQTKRLDSGHTNANLDSFDIFYSDYLYLIHGGNDISMRIFTLSKDYSNPSIASISLICI